MLSTLTSHRLKKSVKTRASPFVLERLFQVILKRLQDPENSPPLKIAVFGGSVTEGHNSRHNNIKLPTNIKGGEVCTWSCKLERLLNELLRPMATLPSGHDPNGTGTEHKIVEVHNYAVSGTDSSIGVTLLEYNLFGADMSEIDVFISSFGANDQKTPKGLYRDRMYLHMQRFLRIAKYQRPCNDLPLVMQIGDVLGDTLMPSVLEGLQYFREMVETNDWAGFMSLSYSDAVRDVVYKNSSDQSLHQFGELHPGMTFHTGVAWIIAYNLLEGFLDACDASSLPEHQDSEPRNGFPLPVLHGELLARDALQLWKQHSEEMSQLCTAPNATTTMRCQYKYIAHKRGAATAEQVHAAISKVATNIDGWEGYGSPIKQPRRTWKAMQQNATFTIQLDNISVPINRMLVLYLKSYGADWESTRLEIVVEGKSISDDSWTELNRRELVGFHDAQTSISYSEDIELGAFLRIGSSVKATFTVIQGNTFQINGLALCHSPQPVETIKR